jgi:hypothetical protein
MRHLTFVAILATVPQEVRTDLDVAWRQLSRSDWRWFWSLSVGRSRLTESAITTTEGEIAGGVTRRLQ